VGIRCRRGSERETGIDELLWVDGVGGEEDVLRSAVGQLLRKRGRRSEGGNKVNAGRALVSGGERGHYGLEVGGAGDLQLLLRVEAGHDDHESEE
jgi:hypothetical protein